MKALEKAWDAFERWNLAMALKDPAARQKAIREIETTLSPAISANKGGDWIKHLYLGEVARVKGRSGLEAAQYHFRTMLEEGSGEVKLAFDRLLTVDVALGRPEDIEFDALLVLRYDIRHQYAAANTAGITNLRFRGRTARRRDGSNELG